MGRGQPRENISSPLTINTKALSLLEITLKSRQNQDKCLGTSRQWVQRKNIYFAAKKQQVSLGFLLVSLGFSWFCLDFKVISSSGGGGRGGTRRGAGGVDGGERANVQ